MKSSRPPLSKLELQAIQARRRDDADVIALLWEIKRLRGVLSYADQLQSVLGDMGGAQGMILNALRAQLKDEPFVKEFPRLPPEA
jgi:hypothetical protein